MLNRTIAGCLRDEPAPLEAALAALPDDAPDELVAALEPIPGNVNRDTISPTGYAVDTLQAATYHGLTATDAETGIVDAVNRAAMPTPSAPSPGRLPAHASVRVNFPTGSWTISSEPTNCDGSAES